MSPWNSWLQGSYRQARRVAIAIVGFSVLAFGIVLLVTPGPAFVVIPIGLGILAIEFTWARRWLLKIKEKAQTAAERWNGKATQRDLNNTSDEPESEPTSAGSTSPDSSENRHRAKPPTTGNHATSERNSD